MTKFFKILNRKFTVGNVLTIIGSCIFAIIARHLYLYLLDYLPVKGELEKLDISYLGIVVLFKFIFSVFLEYLLNDKFSIPLSEAIGKGVGQKQVTTLSMVNSGAEGSSAENSSKGKNTVTKKSSQTEKNNKFIDEEFKVGDKMWDVLSEQTDKIIKLKSMRNWKRVEFYEEDGNLEVTVPMDMTQSESEKLSKEIGAIDRSLQNKFSEYKNLSKKDARLYQSTWSNTYKPIWDNNLEQYEELFKKNKK